MKKSQDASQSVDATQTQTQNGEEGLKAKDLIRALDENEGQLRLISNALPVLVAYIDPTFTYTSVNAFFEKWYGKKSFEIIGQEVGKLIGSDTYDKLLPGLKQAMNGQIAETTVVAGDQFDRAKTLAVTFIPDFYPTREVRGVVEIAQDITDRLRQERENKKLLFREQSANEASRMKSHFLASMSSRIRTPLTTLNGAVDLLQGTSLSQEQKEYAENIKASAALLLRSFIDILAFSKGEDGILESEEITFDWVSTLQELYQALSFDAESKGLKFTLEIDPKIPPFVLGDPGRIRQITNYLLTNAIQYTQKGEIKLGLRNLEEKESSVTIECRVEDSGIGISETEQNTLFEAKSGLGLRMAKHLVNLMSGEIFVESVEGKGSTFRFVLSLPKMDSLENEEYTLHSDIDPEESKNYRLLVAEDNPSNQKVIVRILQKFGFEVEAVSNGKEAVTALKTKRFDMVLMDCQMPQMDGFEAARTIRNDALLPHAIPIVAMTANAMRGDNKRCIQAGMDDYISKPIVRNRLAGILVKWMKRWKLAKARKSGKVS